MTKMQIRQNWLESPQKRTEMRGISPSTTPRGHALAGLVAALAVLAALLPVTAATAVEDGPRPAVPSAAWLWPSDQTLPLGATPVGAFNLIGATIATGPMPAGAVALDEPLAFEALLGEPDPETGALDSGVATLRAPDAWAGGSTGDGAVVALIDTGIAPVAAMDGAVVGEIDFTGTGGGDGYGHGTFLASLVAGRGNLAPGVAPDAGVLSLKVADDEGKTTVGTVLAAMEWLGGPGRAGGIRIGVLALGLEDEAVASEWLDFAVDRLAARDVLVLVSAGNEPGQLASPATASGAFTVGAIDDNGTADRTDDVPADFSASGVNRAGVSQPDSSTPGVAITGHMDPASHIARTYPAGSLGGELFRGSGTSMSVALAGGVAALASGANPALGGADLAAALLSGDPDAVDALDAVHAAAAMEPSSTHPGNGNGPGSNNGKGNGNGPGSNNGNGNGPGANNGNGVANRGPFGADGASLAPGAVRWHAVRWHHSNPQWQAVRWHAVRWHAVRWHAVRWHDGAWGDSSWDGARWGAVRWHDGSGWQADDADLFDGQWDAVRWHAVRWHAVRWHAVRWNAVRWNADFS